MKKVYNLTFIPILSLLVLLTTFLVGCSSRMDDSHPADSIPNSNVYEDIAQYVKTNGQSNEYGIYKSTYCWW